ncbi:MAG: GWxTD domain-containing protein [Cyclonatronaceae bacterium]
MAAAPDSSSRNGIVHDFAANFDDPYEAGLALRDSLGLAEVLTYWESVYRKMREDGRHDPRIGFRFVEFAVAAGDPGRYELATAMYEWGLRAAFEDRFANDIRLEMRMMEPLVGRRTFRNWQQLFSDRDPQLLLEIQEFWFRNNVVPSTERNERLIEHWQRIHYSREHFTNDTSTVYGADERALIYVRLGHPDRSKSGTLTYNTAELRNRLYDLVEVGMINVGQIYTLQMNIMQNYSPGRYDFWRYDRLSADGPVIYLFGQPGRDGRYRLLESLEDFISGSGYRSVVIGRRGTPSAFRAGYFLQMMLYNELSTLDHYFGTRLMEYERRWNQALFLNNANARMLGELLSPRRAARDMQLMQDRAPQSQSIYERNLINYPLSSRQHRFLDEDQEPVTFFLMQPAPMLHQISSMINEQTNMDVGGYLLRQGFYVYSEGRRILEFMEELEPDVKEADQPADRYHTTAEFPIVSADARVQVFSELYLRPGSPIAGIIRNSLVGLSLEWQTPIEPITDHGGLLTSDLVLGSPDRSPVRIRNAELGVLVDDEIPVSEDLQVYFEVYNLTPGEQGVHRYHITYRLIPEKRRWFFRRRSREVSLSWEAASGNPTDHQFFEVDLSHAEAGKYTLEIIVNDDEKGESYSRSLELELTE